ncbi:hypothetical protein JS44_14930 [Anoxybacillus flavithermus]|uniref:Uncharacterized protein n=1 Tax=Anoxybacillus flavithermus TaxID=33934 RepID=A0A094J2D6_9BACL|nr:hypothetical protein JS44_14930 [Anoxybacillus flavithermus]
MYKLIPEDIKDEFDIKLLKQDLSQEYFKELIDSDAVVVTEGNYLLDKISLMKTTCYRYMAWVPIESYGFCRQGREIQGSYR